MVPAHFELFAPDLGISVRPDGACPCRWSGVTGGAVGQVVEILEPLKSRGDHPGAPPVVVGRGGRQCGGGSVAQVLVGTGIGRGRLYIAGNGDLIIGHAVAVGDRPAEPVSPGTQVGNAGGGTGRIGHNPGTGYRGPEARSHGRRIPAEVWIGGAADCSIRTRGGGRYILIDMDNG